MALRERVLFWTLAAFSPLIIVLLTVWGVVVEFGLKSRFSLEKVESERQRRTRLFDSDDHKGSSSLLSSIRSLWSFAALELFCFQASLLYYLRPTATIIAGRTTEGGKEKEKKREERKSDRQIHPKGLYADVPLFKDDLHARINCFSLALAVKLWTQPHYRSGTFANDMKKNLRNVAIPGTGFALSHLVFLGRPFVSLFLLFVPPLISLLASLNSLFFVDLLHIVLPGPRDPIPEDSSSSSSSSLSSSSSDSDREDDHEEKKVEKVGMMKKVVKGFRDQMLRPEDWFWFWTLNCRLASYHSLFNPEAQGYRMEDKWTFLKEAATAEIPVSPWIENESIVVKNTNEEGGLGIHFFRNATAGGPWIIQDALYNHESISSLLPLDAPLSTFRVMTCSRFALHSPSHRLFSSSSLSPHPDHSLDDDKGEEENTIDVMSCVFRAGRKGAATDHQSILFDVDLKTGEIGRGTTNAHWYQLGLNKIPNTPWISSHSFTAHPDTGTRLSGKKIPNIEEIVRVARNAHFRLLPDVPMAGWDVALTTRGLLLLEVNLSCNFFRGQFDVPRYLETVHYFFLDIEHRLL